MARKTKLPEKARVLPVSPPAQSAPPSRHSQEYPLELVAGVAVHRLQDCNPANAAKEAIDLLRACRKALADASRHSQEYPLELVAGLAVHRLKNEKVSAAAKEAIDLLDACRKALANDASARTTLDLDTRNPHWKKWPELRKYLFGDDHNHRAQPKLKAVLECWPVPWPDIPAKIKEYKRDGACSREARSLLKIWKKIEPAYLKNIASRAAKKGWIGRRSKATDRASEGSVGLK